METLERTPPQPQAANPLRALSLPALDWSAIATWLLSALLVVYLGLENGGYDPIPRGQVGIAVWWLVLLGVAVEALPVPGRTRAGLAALGLLSGFAVWTGLAFIWTESAERTATELARVATYLGVFVLGICLVTRRRAGARSRARTQHLRVNVTSRSNLKIASTRALSQHAGQHRDALFAEDAGPIAPTPSSFV